MADDARVEYRAGTEFGPPALGRFELTFDATGAASLTHRHDGLARAWTARVDPAVWPRLVEALRRSRFPRTPPLGPPGRRVQELAVTGVEPAGEVWMRWGDGDAIGLAAALRILDSLVHQVGNGAVPGTVSALPWVVRPVSVEDQAPPVPAPVAAFGDAGGGAAGVVVGHDGRARVVGSGILLDGGSAAALRAVALAPGVVLAAGDDGLLRLWSADGAPLAAQIRHTAPVRALTTTVDEASLLIWSADLAGALHQHGLEPGRPVRQWPAESAGITALRWARAGVGPAKPARAEDGEPATGGSRQVLVAGTDDGWIGWRDVADATADRQVGPGGLSVRSWPAHDGAVNAVAVIGSDDDFLIASGGADHAIRVRNGTDGTEWMPLVGHKATVSGLAFGLIGERLVLGSCALDGTIRTWDPVTGGIIAGWSARNDWPCALADAAAGGVQRWATGGADGIVRIWDAATGRAALTLAPHGAAPAGAASADGASDGAAPDGAGVLSVATALLPGHTLVAAGYGDGSFRVWDAVTGTPLGVDTSSSEPITSVEFGRDGGVDVFVCGTAAGSVRVYDPATAALRHDLTPHTDQVLAVAAGPSGLLASGGADHTVRLWDAGTGWPLHCLRGHTDLVTAVAVGRSGSSGSATVVVSGGYDRTVRVWDAATGALLHTNGGARSAVYALALGETGGRAVVAAGGYDDAVRLLDLETGIPVLATDPVDGFVRSLALGTRDGREILVAAAGNAVRCWALPDGSPLWTIELADPPLAVAIGPDGAVRALGAGGLATAEPSAR